MVDAGSYVQGESGRKYRLLSPLSKRRSRVWIAEEADDGKRSYVVKEPSPLDSSQGWPLFKHEVQMQKKFSTSPLIRKMEDLIPETNESPPIIVLEAFEQILWEARNSRPLTIAQIRWIMKGVLLVLWTIHREGLVYSDLKMENILLNGFDNAAPGNIRAIVARLGDCGAISKPDGRRVSAITYRSPEVHFGRAWDSKTDIWSWGIVIGFQYCHLLEARVDFLSPGAYDSICKGTMEEMTKAVRDTIAEDFNVGLLPYYKDDETSRKLIAPGYTPKSEDDWLGERLLKKGVPEIEIAFLIEVLHPVPEERLGARGNH
ncbi:Protein kinase-like (PK-like) [Glarea lozoyensis ATCC 20868]|uniref:Protein kinase-like (PK-like) n=1 Tax=Glarea lozoyensis (strain ATCC 20868 / MF5171) TaxID=1116229 RepID=S3CV71_GLAL2|nr:Protein kinase-like (PK-like) [Glarea lozoyensis ATCC 20868]EPE30277.1 Protein kinase-like (PK-like) [Glarea lozoyensis ATCC 20868]